MRRTFWSVAVLLAFGGWLRAEEAGPADPGELANPVALTADGKTIDMEIGHADPFVTDWDGDGVPDLLVGQFGRGKLFIYRNVGTAKVPKLAKGEVFRAGGEEGKVPSG